MDGLNAVEGLLGMFQNGFTWDGTLAISRIFLVMCLLSVLYTVVSRVSGSIMIRFFNKRVEPGTALGMQDNAGVPFVAKVLKVGWFRVFLLHSGTGGLLDPTTNSFNAKTKHYLPTKPEGAGEFMSLTAADFGE